MGEALAQSVGVPPALPPCPASPAAAAARHRDGALRLQAPPAAAAAPGVGAGELGGGRAPALPRLARSRPRLPAPPAAAVALGMGMGGGTKRH